MGRWDGPGVCGQDEVETTEVAMWKLGVPLDEEVVDAGEGGLVVNAERESGEWAEC